MGLVIGLGGGNAGGGGGVVAGGLIQDMEGVTFTGTAKIADKTITEFPVADCRYLTSLESMFQSFNSLVSVGELKNTGKVNSTYYMFYDCSSLQTIPLFDTSAVKSMNSMFQFCVKLQSVAAFDTSKVTSMNNMFNYCSSLTSIGGTLNMVKVTKDSNTSDMLYKCTSLVTANISNLGVSLDLSWCKVLSIDSVLYLFNNAQSGVSGKTIQLNSLVFDQLTEDQIAIATEKGFSVTSVVRS